MWRGGGDFVGQAAGDARLSTLVYLSVDDVDAVARKFGVRVEEQPWAREVELADPDGNRWRIGQ